MELVSNLGTHFDNEAIGHLMDTYKIKHRKMTPYHPQSNGQVKCVNRVIYNILTKTCNVHRTDWDKRLHSALWVYQTSHKVIANATPFKLVYGQEVIIPIELEL